MSNTNTVTAVSQETINSLVIDMIRGVKTASGEVYDASKMGIAKAIDFAQENARPVVQEFLTWNFTSSVIMSSAYLLGILLVLLIIRKSYKVQGKDADYILFFGLSSIFGGIFSILLFVAAIKSAMIAVKVKVAPRIFLIEWVAEQVNPSKDRR